MKLWSSFGPRARWVLLASLCLNIALVSYISTQWLRPPPRAVGMMMPTRLIERVAERLPKDDADILWSIYRGKEAGMRPLQADYLRALGKTLRVVANPELDKAGLRAAAAEARDQRLKIGDTVMEIFLETLEQISPEGRRQLVRGLPG